MKLLKTFNFGLKSFTKKTDGFGMIEAVITLPLFLTIMFAVIEFGTLYMKKSSLNHYASNIAAAVRANPVITQEELKAFIVSLDPDNSLGCKDGATAGTEGYCAVAILSYKTPPSNDTVKASCGNTSWNYSNPWANDNDPTNDSKVYYIGVCTTNTFKMNTQFFTLIGDEQSQDDGLKTINSFAVEAIGQGLPVCPVDQILLSQGDGTYKCAPKVPECPAGQVLISNGDKTYRCSSTQRVQVKIANDYPVVQNDQYGDTSYTDRCKTIVQERAFSNDGIISTGPLGGCPANMVLTESYLSNWNCTNSTADTWGNAWPGGNNKKIYTPHLPMNSNGAPKNDKGIIFGYEINSFDPNWSGAPNGKNGGGYTGIHDFRGYFCKADIIGTCCPQYIELPK